ncbi:hypothetical protein SUGI_0598230 [Cryptomeria japonica]|nr:hypothetical protein SUGI_0598230 [Cryptomeria japonica]
MEAGKNGETTTGASKKARFRSFYRKIKAFSPIPYLLKAIDFYVKSVSQCAGSANYGSSWAVGGPGISIVTSPNPFGTGAFRNDEEFGKIGRNASPRTNPSQEKPNSRSFGVKTGSSISNVKAPNTFGTAASRNGEEFDKVVKNASQRSNLSQEKPNSRSFGVKRVPCVGRIDEDSPCYFPASFRKSALQPDLRFPCPRICQSAPNS